MINNRFNVVYHLLGLVKLLFYKLKNIDMKENEIEELYDFYCKSFENQSVIERYSFDTDPMTKVMFVEKIKNLDWFKNEWIEKLKNSKQ
jgi:hypothetical protein